MKPKVIVSHDVDHLFPREHYTRDLIYPKLWVRSFLKMAKGSISPAIFKARFASTVEKRRHRLPEMMDFDEAYGVPSTFFFGMNQGLGMSYKPNECKPVVEEVMGRGFDVGVHGICYDDGEGIREEHDRFKSLFGVNDFGIRMHYVRRDDNTFSRLSDAGYLFDTTQFGKDSIDFTAPYKVGNMWEFPLYVMDGYIVSDGALEEGMENTFQALEEVEKRGLPYFTVLFHDYLFNDICFPTPSTWYKQLIDKLATEGYEFVSYKDAIKELER